MKADYSNDQREKKEERRKRKKIQEREGLEGPSLLKLNG
jgi:hypothetical protein